MDIKEVREKIADYLRTHSREGDCPCEEHQAQMYEWADQLLSTIISEGKVCDECLGNTMLTYRKDFCICPKCNGTGKLPPVTIEDIIGKELGG